jgi:hypothetical protein
MAKQKSTRTTPIIKNTNGGFVHGREETEAIMSMLYRAQTETLFKGKVINIVDDDMVDGERTVIIDFKDAV